MKYEKDVKVVVEKDGHYKEYKVTGRKLKYGELNNLISKHSKNVKSVGEVVEAEIDPIGLTLDVMKAAIKKIEPNDITSDELVNNAIDYEEFENAVLELNPLSRVR